MKYRLFVIANLGFIIGILLGLYFKESIILFLSIFVVCVVMWRIIKHFFEGKLNVCKRNFYKLLLYFKVYITKTVLIVFISFLFFGYALLICKDIKFENFCEDMKMCEASENVMGYGVIVSDKKEKEYSDVYKIKVFEVNGKSYFNTYGFINLKKKSGSELDYGDLVYFDGEYQEPQDRTNFKGFSYKVHLKTINVYGTFKSTYNKVDVLKESHLSWPFMVSNKVKVSFERSN